jgi:hypothetical protein
LVLIQTFSDIGKKLQSQLLSLLVYFSQVNDLCALGFRHFAEGLGVLRVGDLGGDHENFTFLGQNWAVSQRLDRAGKHTCGLWVSHGEMWLISAVSRLISK